MPASNHPRCPRCGGTKVTLCGKSVQYLPEEFPNQSLEDREVATSAWQCECGLAFTDTQRKGKPNPPPTA